MLSSALPLMAHDLPGVTALSLMSCGRLFQQITHHLATGAAIVVVDAQSPEQQLGVSRVLLELQVRHAADARRLPARARRRRLS